MPTTFPSALDVIADPTAQTSTADAGFYHDVMHANENDAIMAIETKVGITNSPVTSSLDYQMHNHQHTGVDGSSVMSSFNARPSVDGPVLTSLNVAGVDIFQINSAVGNSVISVFPQSSGTPGVTVKGVSAQAADLLTAQNSAGVALAGITGAGFLYSNQGLTLSKNTGGSNFLSTNATAGELQFVNGAVLRGFSGAYTGEGGAGEEFYMDSGIGFLKLGGTSGQDQIQLNAWKALRTSSILLSGKDNTDSGTTQFQAFVDADAQTLPTVRSMYFRGQLGTTASGTPLGYDGFIGMSFPTFDGSSAYTKAVGVSVLPATPPPMSAGTFSVAGNLSVTGTTALSGSLTTTGNLTASGFLSSTTPIQFPNSANVTATTATAGAAGALPSAVFGYLKIVISGTTYKVPYYAN